MIERYQQALFHKLEYIFDNQDDKRQALEVFNLQQGATLLVLHIEEWNQESNLLTTPGILLVDSLQERYSHKSLTDIERVYSSSI